MPAQLQGGLRIGSAQPRDAFEAFARRGQLQPTFNWHDLWRQEHAGAFMVAGVAQADVLQLFYGELAKSLASGGSLADFSNAVRDTLVSKGWWGNVEITNPDTGEIRTTRFNDARLSLIYDTNLRQSYAAGRWQAIEANKARKPYVMYRTMRDERVRASHARWDGVTLPVDDAFWRTHYPPNGWRCRCRAFAVSERDIQRYRDDGLPVKTEPPQDPQLELRDPRTGLPTKVPLGIDPGWDYNAGQAGLAHAATLQRAALDAAPRDLAVQLVRQALSSQNFARFVAGPLEGVSLPVAMLGADQAQRMGAVTRTVSLSADTATKQAERHPEVSAEDYAWVQLAIDAGEAVQDGPRSVVHILERDGWVAVVKATNSGQAVYVTSLRKLSSSEAKRDEEVRRLRAKARKGADGGAPHSA